MSKPISILLSATDFTPGGTVSGKISWATSPTNETIELRLFWFTEGRGSQDIEAVDQLSYDTTSRPQGEEDFVLHLPTSPLSFSGQLVSLQWAVEGEALEDNVSEKIDITVSLTGGEVTLPVVDSPRSVKKKKRRRK